MNINLLPWREHKIQEQKKQFVTMLVVSMFLGIFLIFIANLYVKHLIHTQKIRNDYLNQNISELEQKIVEIKNIKEKKKRLLERMAVIQNLHNDRPKIVEIFDSFVRVVPDGVYFEYLSKKGTQIEIKGVSENNGKISALMRNLNKVPLFDDPNLIAVKALESGEGSRFHLTVQKVKQLDKE